MKFFIKIFILILLTVSSILIISEFFLDKRINFFQIKNSEYNITIAERVKQYDYMIPVFENLDKQDDLNLNKINANEYKNFIEYYNEFEYGNPITKTFFDKTFKNLSRRPTPFYELNTIANYSSLNPILPPNFKILSDSFLMAMPSMFLIKAMF